MREIEEMDKLKVLLIMLLAASGGLAVSLYILALSLLPTQSPLGVFEQILTNGFSPNVPFAIPLSTLLFLCTILASFVGVIYFLVIPEIKTYVSGNGNSENVSVVIKTLKPEERKVVGVLDAHGGSYMQKFITKEASLSRLKTHRVIASLSERGIVHVEASGNTNVVSLAKWFHEGMHHLHGQLHTMITEDDISKLAKTQHVLVLMAILIALKEKRKSYTTMKQVREQTLLIEKSRGVKLTEDLETYLQDLSDRGLIEIKSLNEIGINGVSPQNLDSFLETLLRRLRSVVESKDKMSSLEIQGDQTGEQS